MPFGTDMLEEAYALRRFAVDEIHAGRPFPVWNPFAYTGIPYLETLPYPVFYPTSLLYFVMPLGRAIGWSFLLHFALGGIFMFALGRRLRLSRWGAVLAALAFMLNGYLVSHLYAGQDGRMFAMTLIPLVFYFLRVGLDTDRLAPYLLMGGAVALQVFTPHVQVMYFSSLVAAAYALVDAVGRWRRGAARSAMAALGRFALGFAFAAGVAAVQLWPTLTFLKWAVRGTLTGYEYASSWALPAGETTALLIPDLIGSLDTYWGENPFKLHTEYLGAVPLALALAALVWGERRRTLFWALTALAGWLFAMGDSTPVHRLAYELVPMIKSFRAPAMMISVVAFSVAVLSGLGFDAARTRGTGASRAARRDRGTVVLLGSAALLILVWLVALGAPQALADLASGLPERAAARAAALRRLPVSFGVTVLAWVGTVALLLWGLAPGRVRAGVAGAMLATILVLDLWRVDARYFSVVSIDEAFAPDAAETWLQQQEGRFRIFPLPGAMGPNEPVLHRLEALSGLQKFRLAWYDALLGGAAAANLSRIPLWRVLNLVYFVSPQPLEVPGLTPPEGAPPGVYRWSGEAPRAWLASAGRVTGDADALAALSDPAFDVASTVLLTEPLPLPSGGDLGAGASESIRYRSYAPNGFEAEVEARRPSYAVFSEAYHPYWQATVDGRPARIARADLAFRAVAVPPGRHVVRMEYRPRAFERARWVSLAALAAGIGFAALLAWRGRRGVPAAHAA